MERGGKRAIPVWHRRAGKDDVCLHWTAVAANDVGLGESVGRVGNYWHCLPEYEQARKAIWTAVNSHTGKRRIDEAFPLEIRESTDDRGMFIRFKSQSTWQVIGSDRYNSLIGTGVRGVVFSEWSTANPSAWAYIKPIIDENDGWAMFPTTPRGRNHAHRMLEHARARKDWYAQVLPAGDTAVFSAEQLEEARAELITLYGEEMGAAQFEQEYLCSFDAAILGAIYGPEVRRMEREGRICPIEVDLTLPVFTAWDIGFTDDTVILLYQVVHGEVRIFDEIVSHGRGVDWYTNELRELAETNGFVYGQHWLPHDAQARLMAAAGRSVVEQIQAAKIGAVRVLRNSQTEQQGILAARVVFPRLWVDGDRCAGFLDALRNFRREWDDERKCFTDIPVRDWTNHRADALRYLSWVWKEPPPPPAEPSRKITTRMPTIRELIDGPKRDDD